ncbi:DeoR/GlpR family DNA-binding transcription regulator [Cohnella sp. REN36]|uniref:DeoR/GlpR family DNA-binding transcription regulator n=1 Tax=Cohnella sp. REN36 TaxID=2887347 RepID=UPI001D13DA55|nr:DeoR/GlpR family DNA-binding transcription regulator [Cohnella sp. REN36]MCC3373236.1 DeoR/GlpR family DNA-binding transcription regulator [Cohnella sp. REN36]
MSTEREKRIVELLQEQSPSTIEELAKQLQISEVTVRRDLAAMESKGLVARTRGGAALPDQGNEPLFVQRQRKNHDLKRRIAQYAADQIREGEVIALDVGTTTAELAKALVKRRGITVFTSSFQVASILSKSNLQVYMIGGLIRFNEMSMVGSIAIETIKKFNFDRYYLGLASISKDRGLTDYSVEEAEVKQAFIAQSKQVIALADKTKLGTSSLLKVCDFDQLSELITNRIEGEGTHPALELGFGGKITLV